MNIRDAVFERMRQAVGRLVRDGAFLDGDIVLTVKDGALVNVEFPGAESPPSEGIAPPSKPASKRIGRTKWEQAAQDEGDDA